MAVNLNDFYPTMMYDFRPNPALDHLGWDYRMRLDTRGPRLQGVTMKLANAKMWEQFKSETTEMIITKLGRRMFPSIQASVEGLNPRTRYTVIMEITPASKRRQRYVGTTSNRIDEVRGWMDAGVAEPQPPIERRLYIHPDSPATGEHWMQQNINFTKLKLTNNAVDHHNNVILTSMHKYIPQIWIIRIPDDCADLRNPFAHPSVSFRFPETEFIAVTAYQNKNITQLKINNNPFAKGFRENGQSRGKRKINKSDEPTNLSHEDNEARGNASSDIDCQKLTRFMSDCANLDDSGVSCSGRSTSPLSPSVSPSPVRQVHDQSPDYQQPGGRLYRPWASSDAAFFWPRPYDPVQALRSLTPHPFYLANYPYYSATTLMYPPIQRYPCDFSAEKKYW